MSKLPIFVSATIVLFFVSAIAAANPQIAVPETNERESEAQNAPMDENLSVSEPPTVVGTAKPEGPRYYPYHQQLTFRVGQTSETAKFKLEDFVLGFQYLFPKFLSPKLEAGADLHLEGKGHLFAGLRTIFFERSFFRPSYKLSIDHLADADDKLATLTKIDNYYARVSGTLEYVFWNPTSVRLEAEYIANFKESQWIMTVGLSRGW